jgi:ParB family chromosome partitioning protein
MQRSVADILPSELAKAFKMLLEAYRDVRQKQELLQTVQDGSNPWDTRNEGQGAIGLPQGKSVDEIADRYGMSRTKIQRYIRLNYLIEELSGMVDDGKIALAPAVSLSFLKQDEQRAVLECVEANGFKVDMKMASKLYAYSKAGTLTTERIRTVLSGVIKKPGRPAAIKVSPKIISKYFTQEQKQAEIDEIVGKALERWFAERGRT